MFVLPLLSKSCRADGKKERGITVNTKKKIEVVVI